jgi:cysteine dioxygenase type I
MSLWHYGSIPSMAPSSRLRAYPRADMLERMTASFDDLADTGRSLLPEECAELARLAAARIDPDGLDRDGSGSFALLWRNDHSEAWLNTWWEARDTGFHDHGGSCVGVFVIEGRAANEALTVGGASPRRIRSYGPGESFAFRGDGIHRMDHEAGAVTVHVYSPPIASIGHYELVDGELRRTAGPADEGSPPSPRLHAALGPAS